MRGCHPPSPLAPPPQTFRDIPQSDMFWRKPRWIHHLREHLQTSPFRALEQVRTGQITSYRRHDVIKPRLFWSNFVTMLRNWKNHIAALNLSSFNLEQFSFYFCYKTVLNCILENKMLSLHSYFSVQNCSTYTSDATDVMRKRKKRWSGFLISLESDSSDSSDLTDKKCNF